MSRFWTIDIYHMCLGAVWGTGMTLVALTLSPALRQILFGH